MGVCRDGVVDLAGGTGRSATQTHRHEGDRGSPVRSIQPEGRTDWCEGVEEDLGVDNLGMDSVDGRQALRSPRLQRGDRVRVVSPASPPHRAG
jgi:hypothetical protein